MKPFLYAALMVLVLSSSSVLLAQQDMDIKTATEMPINQADIDAYVYLLPKISGKTNFSDAEKIALIKDVGLTKQRMIYLSAKLAIAQAMAMGVLKAQGLEDNKVPHYLRPSAEEVHLVTKNLETILKAQYAANILIGPPPSEALPEVLQPKKNEHIIDLHR